MQSEVLFLVFVQSKNEKKKKFINRINEDVLVHLNGARGQLDNDSIWLISMHI